MRVVPDEILNCLLWEVRLMTAAQRNEVQARWREMNGIDVMVPTQCAQIASTWELAMHMAYERGMAS